MAESTEDFKLEKPVLRAVDTTTPTAKPSAATGGRMGAATTTVPDTIGPSARLLSLDAYRGLIMISLAFAGFGLSDVAKQQLGSIESEISAESGEATEGSPGESAEYNFWENVRYQFSHVEWTGCGYWDMIQPSFMFMVGVSMAYSYVRRFNEGHTFGRMLAHAAWRSFVLIFLGIFLISNNRDATHWSFTNVLTQIGLGYIFLFLLWRRSQITQGVAAFGLLAGVWALYTFYPGTGIDLATGAPEVGVTQKWAEEHLQEIPPAWQKNANAGQFIDVWFLNLLPQQEPYVFNRGGYQTINFVASLATMIFGLMCGELLRSDRSAITKLAFLVLAGIAGIVLGMVLEMTGLCPIIKRIWSPSWAIYSTGICCLILASLFLVFDIFDLKWLAFPLVVVGMNSIAIYCMSMLLKPWVHRAYKTHFGDDVFSFAGPMYEPMVQACMTGLVFWLVCYWMYRHKYFIRI